MRLVLKCFLPLLAIGVVFQTPLKAQQPATISGFVSDPSGSGVPGATLTLVDQNTTVVTTAAKADSDGNFSLPSIPAPATYSLSIQADGFTRREEKNIAVTAGERRALGT